MKSIMEEASSIAKAIEQGWARAGKPQEFTVKVFEEAQKNFFGFTSKPAKIALFFQEHTTPHQARPQKDRANQQSQKKYTTPNQPQQNPKGASQPARQQQPLSQSHPRQENQRPEGNAAQSTPWNPELTQAAQEWIKDSVQLMNVHGIAFDTTVDRYALKFTFQKPLLETSDKEKMLFRSWAYLIMQALRQKFKRPLKGLKVILTSNA